jgi:hypothetical protein
MGREEEAITQTFNKYIQTFQTLEPHATLPYFHVPCMFIPAQGVRVLATAADVEALLTEVMQGLKVRSYERSVNGPPCQTDEREHRFSECR